MPPILSAQSVTKQFGAVPLFRDISLTVDDGDRIGLIGPERGGKIDPARGAGGLVPSDSGELAVRKRARAAYVPQDSRFVPGVTVREVLQRAMTVAHTDEAQREGRLRELPAGPGSRASMPKRLPCPAAGENAWPSPKPWSASRMCSSWMSPPITSTWRGSSGSKNCSPARRLRPLP